MSKKQAKSPTPENLKKFAYTLAEVIIVLLIITVVVSISIKLTKAKLDNITSYTYYSAYQTVNSVTREMLKDFKFDNKDYVSNHQNSLFAKLFPVAKAESAITLYSCPIPEINILNDPLGAPETDPIDGVVYSNMPRFSTSPLDCTVWNKSQYKKYLTLQAGTQTSTKVYNLIQCQKSYNINPKFGKYHMLTYDLYTGSNTNNTCSHPCITSSYQWSQDAVCGQYEIRPDEQSCNYDGNIEEFGGKFYTLKFIKYNNRSDGDIGYCEYKATPDSTPDPDPSCTPKACTGGNEFDMSICDCTCKKTEPAIIPCGKEWNQAQCGLVDRTPWPPVCPVGQEFKDNGTICGCVPITQTVPRTGSNYCKLFVNYTNTSKLAEDDECKGDAIDTDETEFTDKEPDIILRNGMILYNVSQDPEPIEILEGNSKGVTYTKDDKTIDVDEWGYTVYIDIDGSRNGDGKLWEDVYPFYVTLSGTVIPAYDTENEELAGGDSKLHLQTSVYDEFVDNSGRHINWITKSRTFKDSACTMGYVNASTPYCNGVTPTHQCNLQSHDCRLKTIMPVKFFGY